MKKGFTAIGVVAGLVVAVIFLVISVAIIEVIKDDTISVVDRYVCKLSGIIKYGSAKARFGFAEGAGDLKCKINEVKISTKEEDKVKKKIAEEMKLCWWQLGQGELDFFSNIDLGPSDARCIICSEIKAKNDKFDQNIPVDEFIDYLNSNSHKFGDKTTYTEYFYGAADSKIDVVDVEGSIIIDDENPNYVVYMVNKVGSIDTTLDAIGYSAIAAGVVRPSLIGRGSWFVLKNLLRPTRLIPGAIVITSVGFGIGVVYAPNLQATILLAPGPEIVNRCDRLE